MFFLLEVRLREVRLSLGVFPSGGSPLFRCFFLLEVRLREVRRSLGFFFVKSFSVDSTIGWILIFLLM